jgi:hypothetical protein
VVSTSATNLQELRFAALTGYVVMPSDGSDEDIEQEARRLADLLAEDARRTDENEARLERWCSDERLKPIALRTASAHDLRGAVIGVRLRGDAPRVTRVVRDGVR